MTTSGATNDARLLVEGVAVGEVVVLDEPLSFWGGFDSQSGTIIDSHHPQMGADLRGKIVALPAGRGSSSSSAVLAEAIRTGNGPAGIVLRERDMIIVLGAIVADELYGLSCPVVELDAGSFDALQPGDVASLRADAGGVELVIAVAP